MAPRREPLRRRVTDVVVPEDNTGQALIEAGQKIGNAVGNTAEGAINTVMNFRKQKDTADMISLSSEAQAQMLGVTQKWRVENEKNPDDPKAIERLHSDYDTILSSYSDKIGYTVKGDWAMNVAKIKAQYRADNAEWAIKQGVINMENSTNQGIANNLGSFRALGNTFDVNKFRNQYHSSRTEIENFANTAIGPDKTAELMKNYHSDAMKMFMYGAVEADPYKAQILLNQKDVQADINNPEDLDKLRSLVEKGKRQREDNILHAQNASEESMVADYLTDPSKVDIMRVDQEMKDKMITPEFAERMKRTLLSPKTVSAKTDPEVFENIMTKIIESRKNKNITDTSLRNMLLDAHENGSLSDSDFKRFYYAKMGGRKTSVQEGYIKETSPKQAGWWGSMIQRIQSVFPHKEDQHNVIRNTVDRMQSEDLPETQLPRVAQEETTKQQIINNPNRSKYELNQVVTGPGGKSFRVVGFDDDGEPLVDEVK